jgi:tetratricopeptide (TPR) repeat protein
MRVCGKKLRAWAGSQHYQAGVVLRTLALFVLVAPAAFALTLQEAYDALAAKQYDRAIQGFEQALSADPARSAIHQDLAYTLLKIGENDRARDHFAAAMRLDPKDDRVAMEYAFLCFESGQKAAARRVFDQVRQRGNATAEQAFQNIDRPLATEIARWSEAVKLAPDNFSAHLELARLAEQRDELALAAEHYEKAWHLKPAEPSLLLDLGRVWQALGQTERAVPALIAASRGPHTRTGELARELLPARYPYVYEFERAVKLDPSNAGLRREFAYLLLAMNRDPEAEDQFAQLSQLASGDLVACAQLGFLRWKRGDHEGAKPCFDKVLAGNDEELADRVRLTLHQPRALKKRDDASPAEEAKIMAARSIAAGYLPDAKTYLAAAHEADPADASVVLKLGWVNNILHDDREAIEWFNQARKSSDPVIASEAGQAYDSLRPEFARFRTTTWLYPLFSTRWHDLFGYAQTKTEIRVGTLPLRAYFSTRFIGDTRQTIGPAQYLSESSVIFGVGLSTFVWRGLNGWFEAGEAVKYLPNRQDVGTAIPDYRGGLAYARGVGHLLTAGPGWFAETNDDLVYISRFQRDTLLYLQTRAGYTLPEITAARIQSQVFWNANLAADRLRQYWANTIETGPGLRFRLQSMPKSMLLSVSVLRGAYTINEGNPRGPNYFDLRAGLWYAFTH